MGYSLTKFFYYQGESPSPWCIGKVIKRCMQSFHQLLTTGWCIWWGSGSYHKGEWRFFRYIRIVGLPHRRIRSVRDILGFGWDTTCLDGTRLWRCRPQSLRRGLLVWHVWCWPSSIFGSSRRGSLSLLSPSWSKWCGGRGFRRLRRWLRPIQKSWVWVRHCTCFGRCCQFDFLFQRAWICAFIFQDIFSGLHHWCHRFI